MGVNFSLLWGYEVVQRRKYCDGLSLLIIALFFTALPTDNISSFFECTVRGEESKISSFVLEFVVLRETTSNRIPFNRGKRRAECMAF